LKSGSLNLLETSGPVKACNGITLLYYYYYYYLFTYLLTVIGLSLGGSSPYTSIDKTNYNTCA
jgi:restriction endonuclease S subunit